MRNIFNNSQKIININYYSENYLLCIYYLNIIFGVINNYYYH